MAEKHTGNPGYIPVLGMGSSLFIILLKRNLGIQNALELWEFTIQGRTLNSRVEL